MLKALIFDFDGLILDTETPEVLVWQSIYKEYGFELPVDEWEKTVGGYGLSNFDPAQNLSLQTQGRLDAAALKDRYKLEVDAIIQSKPIQAGVVEMIATAKAQGLKVAIGSSSPHVWVDTHTQRLQLFNLFDHIICQDDVAPGRTKPHPDIYLKVLETLSIQNTEAVVFEDSPNGVLAAQRAAVFVVAVPNPLTARMGVKGDLTITSLSEITLADLQARLG